jgi:hypothetical protein
MKSARVKLILMFLLFASPFIVAWIAYFVWTPAGSSSRGELLKPPVLLGEAVVVTSEGKLTPWKSHPQAAGKWIILQADAAACDADCEKKLTTMRQAHAAMGKYRDRVKRAYLIESGQPDAALKAKTEDWIWLDAPAIYKQLPSGTNPRDHIYLVDPLGNLFMRYRKDVDVRDIHKDLTRVLKASQIG